MPIAKSMEDDELIDCSASCVLFNLKFKLEKKFTLIFE